MGPLIMRWGSSLKLKGREGGGLVMKVGRIGEQGWNMGNLAPSGEGDAPGGRTLGSVLWEKSSNGKN